MKMNMYAPLKVTKSHALSILIRKLRSGYDNDELERIIDDLLFGTSFSVQVVADGTKPNDDELLKDLEKKNFLKDFTNEDLDAIEDRMGR